MSELIPIDQIKANRFQPRTQFETESLAELAKSIQQQGMLQAIVVRRVRDGYALVAGERRLRACIAIGRTEIAAEITEGDELSGGIKALVENTQRENPDNLSIAKAMKKLMAASEKAGKPMSQRDLAKATGLSVGYIRKRLDLLATRPDVQELVQRRPDALASALEINRVTDDAARGKLIRLAEEGAPYIQIQEGVQRVLADQRWKGESQRPDAATRKHTKAAEERQREAIQQCKTAVQELTRFTSQLEAWLPECAAVDASKLKPSLSKVTERLSRL